MSIVAVVMIGAVAYIDEATGPYVEVDLLYTFPVLLSGWYLGSRGSFSFAVATTAAWLTVRVFGHGFPTVGLALHVWNAVMQFAVNWTVAYLLSRSRLETYAVRSVLERARRLPDIIPICAWCRKLKDAHEEWQTLEQFLSKETDVRLTHGVCQNCAEQLLRESEEIEARAHSLP
jgi:uncharacterized membrane protein YvlD (DUF360 family)